MLEIGHKRYGIITLNLTLIFRSFAYFLFGMFLGAWLGKTLGAEEEPIPARCVYSQVNKLKEGYLRTACEFIKPHVVQNLNEIDFSDDSVPEIEMDRVEAAFLYYACKDRDSAVRLLNYNIFSKVVGFDYSVYSACLGYYSGILNKGDLVEALVQFKENPAINDIESLVMLVVLNSEMNHDMQARGLWILFSNARHFNVDKDALWRDYKSQFEDYNIDPDVLKVNLFRCVEVSDHNFLPLWKLYFAEFAKRQKRKLGIRK